MTFNWQQKGWPEATATRDLGELEAQGAIVADGLGGPATHYRLNGFLYEPIELLNEPLNERLVGLIARRPGVQLPYLKSVVGASTATIKRAIASLVAARRIEHRGSKKTGGYYRVEEKK